MTTKNIDVIRSFLFRGKNETALRSKNMHILETLGNQGIISFLYSYDTPIATCGTGACGMKLVFVVDKQFSQTTAKQLNQLLEMCYDEDVDVLPADPEKFKENAMSKGMPTGLL